MSRYSFGEILNGILISVVGIIFISAFFDVFVLGKTYDNYCCCNLDTIYHPINSSNDYENAFCILYNLSRNPTPTTKFDELRKVTNKFKNQMGMTEKDFTWYLYLKKIPIYIIPNFQCNYMLNQLNIYKKEVKYNCIDLSIKSE